MNYLEEVFRECQVRDCNQLLIEECLEGPRVGTFDVFQIATEGTGRAHGYFKAIAYVDVKAQGELMRFAETVALNRGLPVKVFSSVSEAKKWLLEKGRDYTAPKEAANDDRPRR